MNNESFNDKELLFRVAKLYYEENLTQSEIGDAINVSRSTVSRLLQEARDAGIVTIVVNYPWERDRDLEQILITHFYLHDARVLAAANLPVQRVREGMGVLAAEYLDQTLKDGMIFGLSHGRTVASTVAGLRPVRKLDITVVQLMGAAGAQNPHYDAPDLIRQAATLYGGDYRYIHAPLVVSDAHTRDVLLQEPRIQETLSMAYRADIAVVGIGALAQEVSSLIWNGYLSPRDLILLEELGAVGHTVAQHFDADGRLLDIEHNRRSIGIGLAGLRNIDIVIGVAGNKLKAAAILGALRGEYVDVLVTDRAAALAILELDGVNICME